VNFKILGPLEVRDGGEPVSLGPPKQRAVLAVLLVHANRVVSVDRLIDLLWGEVPPRRASGALQAYVHNLRKVLEPARLPRTPPQVLVTRAPGYLLCVDPDRFDATRFHALAAEGHRLLARGRPAEARTILAEALALWRGSALAEFAHAAFGQPEVARLEELRTVAVEDRLEAELALGEHAGAVPELELLVREHPLRERLWGLLMVALYRSGRQGDALRAAAQVRRVLREELGAEPGPALRRLEADVLGQASSLELHLPAEETEPSGSLTGTASVTAPAPVSHTAGGLVGRERPLATLLQALDRAREGHGQLVLIPGEPGIGKTRLVEELSARAALGGALVAWGRGYEGDGVPAFWPWVQVIRALLGQIDAETARAAVGPVTGEIAQIAPEIRELVGEVPSLAPLDPAAARFRLYQAVAELLLRLAVERPMVLVLDDLHWLDVASLELTRFLATRIGSAAILLVGTYRPEDVPAEHPLTAALGELARLPNATRLGLDGLSEPEVARFMAQKVDVEPHPAVVSAVHHRTDGNPFFVAELAGLLAAEGLLQSRGDIGTRVPPGVRDVIRRRLARLPELTNHMLGAAAVVGREFDLALAAQMVQVKEPSALELMDLAVATGIVVEEAETVDGYRFAHPLLQQTVYSELGRGRRAQLHARVAELLRSRWGEDPARAVELAHHCFHAVPVTGPQRAVAAAVHAADMAQARLAYEQAEDQLRRALDLLARMPLGPERSRTEVSVQNRLAAVLTLAQGYASPGVAEAWGRARELCRDLDTAPDLLPSLWGLFTLSLSRLELSAASEIAGQFRELTRVAKEPAFCLAHHLGSAMADFHSGDLVAARRNCAEAVRVCDEMDEPGELAATFVINPAVLSRGYLTLAHWLLGDERRARQTSVDSLGIAGRREHRFSLTTALLFDGWLAILEGDRTWARRRVEQIRINDHGSQDAVPLTLILSGWSHGPDDYAGAGLEMRQAITALITNGFRLFDTFYLGFLADLHLRARCPEAALIAVDQALAEVEATGERFYEAELCRLRGEVLGHAPERAEEAEHWLRRAVAVAESQQAISLQRRAVASLSRSAANRHRRIDGSSPVTPVCSRSSTR
jgi:DNA-binding SARP family transcriptional activator/tetratricopeptide (TPR) repeat protein